jgi:hypothetical protein
VKRVLALLAALLTAGSARAYADPITLTFDGIADGNPVGNYYNGGAGGNLGIQFSVEGTAFISKLAGGFVAFSNEPAPGSDAALGFLPSVNPDIMNVAGGFTTGLAFYYTSTVFGFAPAIISIWSGPNGTGTRLGLLVAPETASNCGTLLYSCWTSAEISFAGTAESVEFDGDSVLFADMTIGATSVPAEPSTVPEPGTVALMGSELVGLAEMVRRRILPQSWSLMKRPW